MIAGSRSGQKVEIDMRGGVRSGVEKTPQSLEQQVRAAKPRSETQLGFGYHRSWASPRHGCSRLFLPEQKGRHRRQLDGSKAAVKSDASLKLQMPCSEGGRRSSRADPRARGAMVPDFITRLAGAAKAASGNMRWTLRQYRQVARRACGDGLEVESGGAFWSAIIDSRRIRERRWNKMRQQPSAGMRRQRTCDGL
jgi:hypothetical protein